MKGATVRNCVLSSDVRIDEATLIEESVVLPGARIGAHCKLQRVVIDAGMRVPDGTVVDAMRSDDVRVTLLSGCYSKEADELACGESTHRRRVCAEAAPSAHARQRLVYGTADSRSSSIDSPHTAQLI